jgi:hypothetical protein
MLQNNEKERNADRKSGFNPSPFYLGPMLIGWIRRQREWNFIFSAFLAVLISMLSQATPSFDFFGLSIYLQKALYGLGIWMLAQAFHVLLTRINLYESTSQFPVVVLVLFLSAFPIQTMDWLFLGGSLLWIATLYNVLRAPGEVRSHAGVFNAGFMGGCLMLVLPAYFYFLVFLWIYLSISGPYTFRQGIITGIGFLLPASYYMAFDYILFEGWGQDLWLRSGFSPYLGMLSLSVPQWVALGVWLILTLFWSVASVQQNAGLKKNQRQVIQLAYVHVLSLLPLAFWLPQANLRVLSWAGFSVSVLAAFYFMLGPANRTKDVLFWLFLLFCIGIGLV